MTIPSAQEIAQAIVFEMKESGHALWIDPELHAHQHNAIPEIIEFVTELKRERKEREARRERINERIAGSLILSLTLFIIGLIGAGAIQWLKEHMR